MARNFVLEQLDHLGKRTYIPPPNGLILELVDTAQTKGGIFLPEVSWSGPEGQEKQEERKKPLGHVLAVSDRVCGDFWAAGPPCQAGDYVLFSGAMGLITEIEEDMFVMNWDCVSLTIRPGDWAELGLVSEPDRATKPTTLSISRKGEA